MFRDYIRFSDALLCFKFLQNIKEKKSPEWDRLRGEFYMYARRRSQKGDADAQHWLETDGEGKDSGDQGSSSGAMSPIAKIIAKAKKEKPEPVPEKELTQVYIDLVLEKLNALTGLESVKEEIGRIISMVRVRQMRKAEGLPVAPLCLHMAFTGNPGTGKTTVARLLAEILHDIGYSRTGMFVETDRGGLVGEYIGQTAPITKKVFESALGGVLFIDEAYAVYRDDSYRDYGRECIATLMKLMEDHRDDIVVIFAGYPAEMEVFLDANPGLSSRVPNRIRFDDIPVDGLVGMFEGLCREYRYSLTGSALNKLRLMLTQMRYTDRREFGSGRGVRNLFERTIRIQAQRLIDKGITDKELLTVIEDGDIPATDALSDGNVVYLPNA